MKNVLLLMIFSVGIFTACQTDSTNSEVAQANVNVSPSALEGNTQEAKAETVAVPLTGYTIGDVAEDFSLKNVDGKMFSLSNIPEAEGYIVVFTCNTCPYAVAYEDRIIALHEKFATDGYPVIAINPNDPDVKPGDSFDNMVVRAKEKAFAFPYVF
ncbi:MAG: hypothetical protein ACI8X3_002866, partial [Saprospiraceae bacterium]